MNRSIAVAVLVVSPLALALGSDGGLEPAGTPPSQDAARRLIRAYLDTPPEPFAVWGWRDAASLRREALEWPRDLSPFRALRSGDLVLAIGGTRMLPGAPPAGDWVLRPGGPLGPSPPLYTGLPSSSLGTQCPPPTLSGDRLTVSVLAAADELALTGSAGQLAHPPCRSHDLLLADLERDSDTDGLTDIAETTLFFTDPADPDTDDDGQPDGADSLPQVPYREGTPDRRSAAVAAFFDCLLGPPDGREASPDRRRAGACHLGTQPRSGVEPVYVVGRRAEWTFLRTRIPLVVLEPDEYRELRQRRPERGLPPLRLDVLELDPDQNRAFIGWSGGAHCGELELTWDGREWSMRELSMSVY